MPVVSGCMLYSKRWCSVGSVSVISAFWLTFIALYQRKVEALDKGEKLLHSCQEKAMRPDVMTLQGISPFRVGLITF